VEAVAAEEGIEDGNSVEAVNTVDPNNPVGDGVPLVAVDDANPVEIIHCKLGWILLFKQPIFVIIKQKH
jgi:hypothetical protein